MCIHSGESLDFWKEQYEKDFPAIKGILLQNIQRIIEQIYNINWVNNFMASELESIAIVKNSQLFPNVFDSFNSYIRQKFKKIFLYEDRIPFMAFRDKKIVVLDPLNKILLSNLSHLFEFSEIKVVVPDFIYYTSPFIKYHTISYQYEALLGGARIWFDDEYQKKLSEWDKLKKSLISDILFAKKGYDKRYRAVRDNTESELEAESNLSTDLIEPEVIEILSEKEDRVSIRQDSRSTLIVTTDNNQFSLKSNSPVLLEQNGFVVQTKAALVSVRALFLPISEVSKTIERSSLLEKLASMPSTAINWKKKLFEKKKTQPNIYKILHELGLSIQEGTFQKDYISEVGISDTNDVHLPRSKQDWRIVCDYLNIKEGNEAWRSHKCREDINSLKRAYKEVITYLNSNGFFGSNVDDSVLEHVVDIFESVTGVTDDEDPNERLETAKSIIRDITKELSLQEVTDIKLIQHEQDN
jgi:hypothetical protein